MTLQGSVNALLELLQPDYKTGSGQGCRITKLSSKVSHFENGVEYCQVEVTCEGGKQYGIQAFGEEAVELYKVGLKRIQPLQKEVTSPVL